MAEKMWLAPREVQETYGISRSLLFRIRRQGLVESATIGSRGVRISRSSIDAYMARQARVSQEDV